MGEKAAAIPWNDIEEKYAALFPGKKEMPAKPLRTVLGSLIIQKQYGYFDRELAEQIRENPYYQFAKKIRKAIRKQLQYVNRALGYIDTFLAQDDVFLKPRKLERLAVIRELMEQQ